MDIAIIIVTVSLGLFFGMLLVFSLFYRLGRHRLEKIGEASEEGGFVSGAIFSLLGLLIAFTFYGAYSRFDARRQLIIQEANAIGTAYLRLDLLPVDAQPALRGLFRKYADSRAALYVKLTDVPSALKELAEATELQQEIWTLAVAASGGQENQSARMLLIPAINAMIDIVTTRTVAMRTHPPLLIFLTLGSLAIVCVGMTGYRASVSGKPGYLYNIAFAAIITFVLYLTLDIEYVRYGLIRLDELNRVLIDLAATMK